MAREEQFLVREAGGTMVTINAYSLDGAKREYLRRYRPARGDYFSIKPRGQGQWQDYKVS